MYGIIKLITAIIRFACGERVDRPTREQNRLAAAYLLFFPILGIAALKLSARFVHGSSDSVFVLVGLAMMAVVYAVVTVWTKLIPAAVTWTFAGIVWAAVIYEAIRGDLF